MTPRPTHDGHFLDAALRELKLEEAQVQAPAHIEAQVMAAWDGGRPHRVKGVRAGFGFARVASVAAGVMLVVALGSWQVQRQSPLRSATPVIELPTAPSLSETVAPTEAASLTPPVVEDSPIESGEQTQPAAMPVRRQPVTLVLLGEPIAAGETVRVVRMRVPGATLAELGIRSISTPRAQSVDLDVIVGEDGVARALRVGM